MPNKKYKIAVIQLNLNDVAENNLKKCLSWVRDAASQGAEVISLPELYSSHYFCQSEDVDNFALAEKVDFVTANPPYLPEAEILPKEVAEHEPAVALRGGVSGMEIPSQFISCAARLLKNGGYFAIEHSEDQAELIKIALSDYFTEVTIHYDLADRPRWTSATRNGLEVSK